MSPTKRQFCHYCKKPLKRGTRTRDHIVPVSRGGLDVHWNIVGACRTCNFAKAAKWPTCPCNICQETIARHLSPDRPEPQTGPRCSKCGDITMTPEDCPWCRMVIAI